MIVHLNKRLSEVAKFVSENAILADVGSDHAFLPCYLVQTNRINKAYAGEVIVGPYNQSIKSVEEYNLANNVFPILSDGLENIPDDTTEISIAGMGAHTILEILTRYPEKVCKYNKLILQANSHMELIREYVSNNNFLIIDESVVYDKGKYYEVCVIEPANGRKLNTEEIQFGPVLLNNKSKTFVDYYKYQLKVKSNVLSQLSEEHEKYAPLKDEIEAIKKVLE